MTKIIRNSFITIVLSLILSIFSFSAFAKGKLTLYCSVEIDVCEMLVQAFEKETGINVAMTRKSSGETFAQIKAEGSNPKGDVWFGGTGDPHLTASQEGLTQEYKSKHFDDLLPAAQNQAVNGNYRTVGIYVGALGYGYNHELIASKGLPEPKSWEDLTNPVYNGIFSPCGSFNRCGTRFCILVDILMKFFQ